MEFGVCTSVDNATALKEAGWDYVEESVQALLEGLKPDAEWRGAERVKGAGLPVRACNLLVPAALKITGAEASLPKLRDYLAKVTERAAKCGVEVLVFGSGGARQVPEGFDRTKARGQLVEFLRVGGELAAKHANVTIVIEPLNRKECNVLNTVEECMGYVREVNLPRVKCLVDTFHFWENGEDLGALRDAVGGIYHVHVADKGPRTAPVANVGGSDYREFFRVLKQGGYDRRISVEATGFDVTAGGSGGALKFLKDEWGRA